MKFPLFLISYHTYIMKFIESFACANLLLANMMHVIIAPLKDQLLKMRCAIEILQLQATRVR